MIYSNFFERFINHDKIRSRESSNTNFSNKQTFHKSSLHNKRRENGETNQPFSDSFSVDFRYFPIYPGNVGTKNYFERIFHSSSFTPTS